MDKRGGLESSYLGRLIIALAVLVLFLLIVGILVGRGTNAIDYIKQILWGR